MKRISAILAFFVCVLFANNKVFSQDTNFDSHIVNVAIPSVFIVDIEPSGAKTISLSPTPPTEAGSSLDFSGATDNSLWLNYSSIVANATATRKVTVQITNGTVPSGTYLKVAGAAAIGGTGTVGTPAGTITLTSLAQDFVTGIGSCYTGDGTSKGHNLTYSLALQPGNYDLVYSNPTTPITVTYTITN
jgi:hypothetical protein